MDGATDVIGAWPSLGVAGALLGAFVYVLRQWHLDRKGWAEERVQLIKGCDEQIAEKRKINQELRADLKQSQEDADNERARRRSVEERAHRAGLRDHDH